MTKTALLGIVALVAVTTVLPDAALADGRRGGGHHHGPRLRSDLPKRVFPDRHFHGHRNFHGHKGFGHKGGFGFYGAPVITYAVPSYTPTYVPPPTYIPPPPAYNPDYSYAPPMPRVVEFPNGRYVLYGDGITTAYRWVWIPNPPAEEPPVAPLPPPAAVPPPAAEPTAAEPPRRTDVYRWTDDAGVVHLTDRLEKVPEAYRSKVSKSVSVTKGQQ